MTRLGPELKIVLTRMLRITKPINQPQNQPVRHNGGCFCVPGRLEIGVREVGLIAKKIPSSCKSLHLASSSRLLIRLRRGTMLGLRKREEGHHACRGQVEWPYCVRLDSVILAPSNSRRVGGRQIPRR